MAWISPRMKKLLFVCCFLFVACQNPSVQAESPAAPVAAPGAPKLAAEPKAQGNEEQELQAPIPHFEWDLEGLPEGIEKVEDQSGRAGRAVRLQEDSAPITVPVDVDPEALPVLTMTVWARFDGDPDQAAYMRVLSHDDGEFDRSLGLDDRTEEGYGWSCFAGSSEVVGGVPAEPGQWVFLAAVYDQPQKKVTFRVNDQSITVDQAELGPGVRDLLAIGHSPSFHEPFVGDIANVRLYDRALTDEEFEAVRNL